MAGQGDEPNAKDDTRYYGVDNGGGLVDLAVDLSQRADDLIVGTRSVWEGSGSRWDYVTVPWAIDLVISASNIDAGYLYSREAGGNGVRLTLVAGGIVEARVNATLVASITIPGIDAGGDEVAITWSAEVNVFTTGASNAVRSELRAFNLDDGGFVQAVATHAVPSAAVSLAIWGARTSGGLDSFTGNLLELRWSVGRFHPAAETREGFVGTTAMPSLAFAARREVPVPTRDSSIGAHNQFAGPVYQAVAAALGQLDIRQAGAVVNELYRDAPTLDDTPPTPRSLDPDGSGFVFLGQYLVHRPVPRTCNRLQVRVHVQAWRTDASAPDNIRVRCYSMARTPLGLAGNLGPLPAWTSFYEEIVVNAADGSGTTGGNWYTFDPLRIARDGTEEGTWLALAFLVANDGGGGTADQRWRVRAWTVEPGIIDSAGELPLGGLG